MSLTDPTRLFHRKGALTLYHREGHTLICPCVTPEGFRSPSWHKANPAAPMCTDSGYLPDPIEFWVKAFVQPVYGSRRIAQLNQNLIEAFGKLEADDHVGMFPIRWEGKDLNFENWSDAGDEWIEFNGRRFIVMSWIPIPDPHNSQGVHHYEVVLRRINTDGPS